jgi:hypothetical protein
VEALQYLRTSLKEALAGEGGSHPNGERVSDPSPSTPVAQSEGVYNVPHLARIASIEKQTQILFVNSTIFFKVIQKAILSPSFHGM